MQQNTSATTTIAISRELFAKYGLPVHCLVENSPQFRIEEFAHFMKVNGVKHVSFVSPIRENVLILFAFDRSTSIKRNVECEARSLESKRLQVPPSTYWPRLCKLIKHR